MATKLPLQNIIEGTLWTEEKIKHIQETTGGKVNNVMIVNKKILVKWPRLVGHSLITDSKRKGHKMRR